MNTVKYIYVEIGYTYNLFVALLIKHNIKKDFLLHSYERLSVF